MSSLYHDYVGWRVNRLGQRAVDMGLPPSYLRYRWVKKESLEECAARWNSGVVELETIHPQRRFESPLPRNVSSGDDLPSDRGWWGYSLRDVPSRTSPPTLRGTLEDALVLPWIDPDAGYFRPAILTRDRTSLEMREISFRPMHARLMRSRGSRIEIDRATWIMERVYDNHSHWLTAHLPKLLLLRDSDRLGEVLLPRDMTATMESSLRMMEIDPARFRRFDPSRALAVGQLTVLATDRFRPDLLRPVRRAIAPAEARPSRRVFISRRRAARRRLLNEPEVWARLEAAGFERVFMEDLSFEEQVALMKETDVLFAPHGAGLTNMMFCPEGATVVEIADPGFPNPNFYALAAAMGHEYWLLPAQAVGDVHPLEKDLRVEIDRVEEVLTTFPSAARRG